MNLTYYKEMEPFWGVWRIKRLLGEGSFGKVFEIEREDFGRVYTAALKIITIPQNESELKSVLSDGMDQKSATEYFKSFVMEVVGEFALMAEFKGNSNIVSYEDHMVVEHRDGIGWDILIRMELLTPLLEYTSAEHPMSRNQVIKLGMDMCRALEYCQKQNVIHRDIKPENIFVSRSGDFKLGDFGIARTAEKTMSGLSRKGTYSYMAPEVYKGEEYGASVDIYSLGIVLYRLLNKNRTPFLPDYPQPITHGDRENAIARRIAGERMLLPTDARDKLGEIILKACAYEPHERYSTPKQMRMELEAVSFNNGLQETEEEERTVLLASAFADAEKAEMLVADSKIEEKETSPQMNLVQSENKKRQVNPIAVIGAAAVIMICLLAVAVLKAGGEKKETVGNSLVERGGQEEGQENIVQAVADEKTDEKETDTEGKSGETADTEPEGEGEEQAEPKQETSVYETEEMLAYFGLNRDAVTDYKNALEPQNYLRYDSGYGDFSFSYPAALYGDVQVDREALQTDYGENTETIRFTGTDGSELIYILSRRTDANGLEDMTEYVYNVEYTRLYEPTELINSVSGNHGKVILTGYTDSEKQIVVYDMTKIEEDYVMQMRVLYPEADSEMDKMGKWYVVECLYRLCKFSDTKYAPRSFDEYVESTRQ